MELLPSWRPLLSNFFSLGFLKLTDALILIIIIPIIIGRIGIANYGIIALVQVFLNYGKTIIDYGFNISGVRQIALARSERAMPGRIFYDILYTRAFVCILLMAILYLVVQAVPYLYQNAVVFYWGMFLWIGHTVFTDWFFIGMKRSEYIARANLVAKLLYAMSVILFIHEPSDMKFVLAFQGMAALITGVFILYFIRVRFRIRSAAPRWKPIQAYLRNDFKLLVTNFSIEFNASYSVLILNILTTNALTGYYSIMQKLLQPLRFLLTIFSQTIFPVVCEKTKEGWAHVKSFLRTTFSIFFLFPIVGVIVFALVARPVLDYFTGEIPIEMVFLFRVFLAVPVIILFNIPAYQVLLAYERKSDYTLIFIISMGLTLFLSYVLTHQFGLKGLILSVILVEVFITLGLYLMVWKNKSKLIEGN